MSFFLFTRNKKNLMMFEHFYRSFKENVRLKKCNVSFNGFDADAGKALADVIKNNTTLEYFNISNTRLNADCAAAIANALEQNDSLKYLNVRHFIYFQKQISQV